MGMERQGGLSSLLYLYKRNGRMSTSGCYMTGTLKCNPIMAHSGHFRYEPLPKLVP